MTLTSFWFGVTALLWTGFFLLEGFDFGAGMLHGVVGHDEAGRRTVINTIGPLWDGNEVWLIVAAAVMFAAFPGWYATMFSAFYLALVLLLVALIARGTSFEFRGKRESARWRRTWDGLMTGGSVLAPLLTGLALGDLLAGLPINRAHDFTGSFWTLFQPYGVVTGVALTLVCCLHGATFLALKTAGDVRDAARRLARRVGPAAALGVLAFAIWTHAAAGKGWFPSPAETVTVLAAFAAMWLAWEGHDGWAFTATAVTIAASVVTLFSGLYPRLMVSSTSARYTLTISNSASGAYSLRAMTIIVIIFLPAVLVYQAWSYYVFRRRLSRSEFTPPARPERPQSTGARVG